MKVIFAFLICLGWGSTSQADIGKTFHARTSNDRNPRLVLSHASFSWANCGSAKEPAVLKSLSIQPDPISIPGDLKASAAGSSAITLAAPLTANITVHKEVVGIWVKIPCVEEIGSCVYNDVCQLLDEAIPPGENCPEPLYTYGLPCHCPFKAGEYSLPNTYFYLPPVELPYWMTNGSYKAMGVLTNNKQELACLEISFSLKSQ
ncbi:ganglioside GM2 activator-like [Carcharodon carcharias]|uniref:ganglioside GM2 activator-like n=1 Tax=Carcharodon carcharias TaxID=13397 RepID=UPI001B7E2F3F|nr:ganglioside GM2 activator-like [Carcharodon carcharias]